MYVRKHPIDIRAIAQLLSCVKYTNGTMQIVNSCRRGSSARLIIRTSRCSLGFDFWLFCFSFREEILHALLRSYDHKVTTIEWTRHLFNFTHLDMREMTTCMYYIQCEYEEEVRDLHNHHRTPLRSADTPKRMEGKICLCNGCFFLLTRRSFSP